MDDGFLIAQVLGGNRNAFRLLVVRYQRPVFLFLARCGLDQAAAEELAQETFLRAFRHLAVFDAAKSSFSTWLFTIARNLALHEAARLERRTSHVALDDQHGASDASPSDMLERSRTRKRVRDALLDLPAVLRSVVALAYIKELSMQEIADIENVSVGTVKSRIFRGKQLLREKLVDSEV